MHADTRELVMIDFDGVIVDSFDVFCTSFLDACRAVGVPEVTTPADLLAIMEDNFYVSMRARGVDDALGEARGVRGYEAQRHDGGEAVAARAPRAHELDARADAAALDD